MKGKIIDIYDVDCVEPSFQHEELKKYKDIHKGKRIFVIGNGPSLKYDDLEKLKKNKEICIAANKIYLAFDNTKWRPNYLCISDFRMIMDSKEFRMQDYDFDILIGDAYNFEGRIEREEGKEYIHLIYEEYLLLNCFAS